ncbi:hypothetical protein A2U01_0119052, partial [Trifolium medium]|nr:hypothetical protein [Trifolium medium]
FAMERELGTFWSIEVLNVEEENDLDDLPLGQVIAQKCD